MTQESRLFGLNRRAAKIALAVSLGVNLLFLGVAGGAALKMHGGDHPPPRFHFSKEVIGAAAPERRDAVRAALERGKEERKARRKDRRGWADDALQVLEARPFDPAALRQIFSGTSAMREISRKEREEALISALSLLTDEERSGLAERMRERMAHRKHGKGK